MVENQGPVVQSIASLMTSFRRQLATNIPTTLSNTLLFLLEKYENLAIKGFHIFSTKNNRVVVIFMLKNLRK